MPYEISPSFKKRLSKKTPDAAGAVLRCIKRLEENPRHPGLHTHRVQGTEDVWEAYVDRSNRLTFRHGDGKFILLNHCNHDATLRLG
jgi:hypothetical protein